MKRRPNLSFIAPEPIILEWLRVDRPPPLTPIIAIRVTTGAATRVTAVCILIGVAETACGGGDGRQSPSAIVVTRFRRATTRYFAGEASDIVAHAFPTLFRRCPIVGIKVINLILPHVQEDTGRQIIDGFPNTLDFRKCIFPDRSLTPLITLLFALLGGAH